MSRARLLAILASLVVAGGLVAALFREVDAAEVLAAASSARPAWIAAMFVAFAANQGLRIVRWHSLLAPPRGVRRTAQVCAIAFLGITLLPLRLGEVIRPALHAADGVPLGRSLAAVVVERLLDLVALLLLLGWVSVGVALPPLVVDGVDVAQVATRGAALAVVAGLAALVALTALGPRLAGVPLVGGQAAAWSAAAAELARSPGRTAPAVGWTALTWASSIGYVWCALHAVPGLPANVEAAAVAWAGVIAAISALPTPGFVGSYEAGMVAALSLLGGRPAAAAAAALGLHVLYVAFLAALGVPAATIEGDRWWETLRAQKPAG